jgi:hypothetical protein
LRVRRTTGNTGEWCSVKNHFSGSIIPPFGRRLGSH